MKKKVTITEGDLRNIIRESIKNILNEGSASSELEQIVGQLYQLTESGYIPFSSPSPSSTEMIVKNNVYQAIECLNKAIAADKQLYMH